MRGQPKRILQGIGPQAVLEGAGVRLKRSFPTRDLDWADPFLLFDHFGSTDPSEYMAGFPMHPHRGIETVTYMLAGAVRHGDSLGNAGVIHAGDVQWMTAGGGIMHEEMPQQASDGRMEGFQLWVNLPARLKMMRPRYQEILAAAIPQVNRSSGTVVRVVAGVLDDVQGPVTGIAADPTYLDVSIPARVAFAHPMPSDHTTLGYVVEGEGVFGEEDSAVVRAPRMMILGDGDVVTAQAGPGGLRFLLMSGKPSGEPIARYGPFVMNTREEILQALRDLQDGTFVRETAAR